MSNKNQNRAPAPAVTAPAADPTHAHVIDPVKSHSIEDPTHAHTPAPTGNEQASADAGAIQGDEPAAPAAKVNATPSWAIGDVVELTAAHGPLHHLHTGEVFGVAPVAAEIDAFIALQLEAGKLVISGAT